MYAPSYEEIAVELEGLSSLVSILAGICKANPDAYSRQADPPAADQIQNTLITISNRLQYLSDAIDENTQADHEAFMQYRAQHMAATAP